jgi:hypothetical protein
MEWAYRGILLQHRLKISEEVLLELRILYMFRLEHSTPEPGDFLRFRWESERYT